jgi:hypothetical protein
MQHYSNELTVKDVHGNKKTNEQAQQQQTFSPIIPDTTLEKEIVIFNFPQQQISQQPLIRNKDQNPFRNTNPQKSKEILTNRKRIIICFFCVNEYERQTFTWATQIININYEQGSKIIGKPEYLESTYCTPMRGGLVAIISAL